MTNLVTRYCRTFDDMRPNAAGQWVRWDDYETLRKQILACAPFLKEGETPAECIERNRKDADAVLTLLAQEKRKNETRQDEPSACEHGAHPPTNCSICMGLERAEPRAPRRHAQWCNIGRVGEDGLWMACNCRVSENREAPR